MGHCGGWGVVRGFWVWTGWRCFEDFGRVLRRRRRAMVERGVDKLWTSSGHFSTSWFRVHYTAFLRVWGASGAWAMQQCSYGITNRLIPIYHHDISMQHTVGIHGRISLNRLRRAMAIQTPDYTGACQLTTTNKSCSNTSTTPTNAIVPSPSIANQTDNRGCYRTQDIASRIRSHSRVLVDLMPLLRIIRASRPTSITVSRP